MNQGKLFYKPLKEEIDECRFKPAKEIFNFWKVNKKYIPYMCEDAKTKKWVYKMIPYTDFGHIMEATIIRSDNPDK